MKVWYYIFANTNCQLHLSKNLKLNLFQHNSNSGPDLWYIAVGGTSCYLQWSHRPQFLKFAQETSWKWFDCWYLLISSARVSLTRHLWWCCIVRVNMSCHSFHFDWYRSILFHCQDKVFSLFVSQTVWLLKERFSVEVLWYSGTVVLIWEALVCLVCSLRWRGNSGEVLCHLPDTGLLQEIQEAQRARSCGKALVGEAEHHHGFTSE